MKSGTGKICRSATIHNKRYPIGRALQTETAYYASSTLKKLL
jgi:hypothetical protein